MTQLYYLTLTLLIASCGSNKPHDKTSELLGELKVVQAERVAEGLEYVDGNGWITPTDCDAAIWASKFGVYYDGFNITASEYTDEPGRFNRRPPPMCREGNTDSRSTWSRDMMLAGLLQYTWLRGDSETLGRHLHYVRGNDWFSGEPRDYNTTFYTPALRGISYQVLYQLTGEDDQWRHTPNVYPSGLNDYRAHLMMVDIMLRGETWGEIDNIMLARVREHADREPDNVFYQVMRGRWLGDWDRAKELCLVRDSSAASYVRCDTPRACYIAEETWGCGLLIRYLESSL